MNYLYNDGAGYVCMDNETFDQISIPEESVGEQSKFLKENTEVEVLFDGHNILGFELPITVDLKITETVPGVKGDTATGGTKQATVETGAIINVPLFVNEGTIIRIDTRTGEYIERVNK